MYEEVVNEGFKRDHNFKITYVKNGESYNYAWIVVTSLGQTLNIKKKKITFGRECIDVTMEKLTGDDLARKCTYSYYKEL